MIRAVNMVTLHLQLNISTPNIGRADQFQESILIPALLSSPFYFMTFTASTKMRKDIAARY